MKLSVKKNFTVTQHSTTVTIAIRSSAMQRNETSGQQCILLLYVKWSFKNQGWGLV